MGCCGGPGPLKTYKFKDYLISTVVIIAIILIIYYFQK